MNGRKAGASRSPGRLRLALLTLGLAAACESSEMKVSDAGAPVAEAGGAPDATMVADVVAPADQVADGVNADGPSTEVAANATFVPITPCPGPDSFVSGPPSVATIEARYSPPCLRIPAGTSVTIEASALHPLEPRPMGTAGNPIRSQFATAPVVFPTPGFYPYQCPEHVDQGMLGVIWVTEP